MLPVGKVYQTISTLRLVVELNKLGKSHRCFVGKRCNQLCSWTVMTQGEHGQDALIKDLYKGQEKCSFDAERCDRERRMRN